MYKQTEWGKMLRSFEYIWRIPNAFFTSTRVVEFMHTTPPWVSASVSCDFLFSCFRCESLAFLAASMCCTVACYTNGSHHICSTYAKRDIIPFNCNAVQIMHSQSKRRRPANNDSPFRMEIDKKAINAQEDTQDARGAIAATTDVIILNNGSNNNRNKSCLHFP